MTDGPDFICIGLAKAGTAWLYDQVEHHPDFWMPPIKEIRYLDREEPGTGRAAALLAKLDDNAGRLKKARTANNRRTLDDRDIGFLKEMQSHRGQALDLGRYGALFRFKGNLLTGDLTPTYCTMEGPAITRTMAAFPGLKVVLLLRDPVARAWSHFAMLHRKEKIETAALQNVDQFRTLMETSKVINFGLPATLAARWSEYVPPAQFGRYFFDDIVAQPDTARGEILSFLGADPAKNSGELMADHNRKAALSKLEMSDSIKAALVEQLAGELRASRDLFGGHAIEWAKAYGV